MTICFAKRFFVLSAILISLLFLPGIALASSVQLNVIPMLIFAQGGKADSDIIITPQVRQKLQGARQRRNRDIEAALTSSQQAQLSQQLSSGNDFNQALEQLKLQPEQREMIKAILQIYNLKMKAISSEYSAQASPS
jgi:hypothetical protein